jgi:hypothetical protein
LFSDDRFLMAPRLEVQLLQPAGPGRRIAQSKSKRFVPSTVKERSIGTSVSPKITALGVRLSWLLDGWDFIPELRFAVDKTVNEQIDSLELILSILPMVPLDERDEEELQATDGLFLDKKGKFIQVLEDWRAGNRIDDLVCRIEVARATAVAA